MKITKLKIMYINDDKEEIQMGKQWDRYSCSFDEYYLSIFGKNKTKYIPLSSMLYFVVEELDDKRGK